MWYCILVQCNNDLHHPFLEARIPTTPWRHQRGHGPRYYTDITEREDKDKTISTKKNNLRQFVVSQLIQE